MTSPEPGRQTPSRRTYDVVIIGGAAIGSSVAFFLATSADFGGSVLVVERDWTYASAATARSSSSIRHQFSNPLNVRLSQFGTEFIRTFRDHVAIDGETPELGFIENGYLFLATEAGVPVLARNNATQTALGAHSSLLSPEELHDSFPWLSTQGLALGSLGRSGEGWFDGYGLMMGLRNKARSLGVEYIENEVVAVRRAGDHIAGIVLRGGQEIGVGAVVNAAGTRGPLVARLAGLTIPVEPRRRSLFVFDCRRGIDGKVPLTIDPSGVFFRPEGRFFLAGATPRNDPAVDVEDFAVMHEEFERQIWPTLAQRVPSFEAIKVVNSWAGHYDFCVLDHNAIVGPHTEVRNFLFANGFSGHGLQQSPAVGRSLSEFITYGAYRSLDLSPLSYERVALDRPFLEDAVV